MSKALYVSFFAIIAVIVMMAFTDAMPIKSEQHQRHQHKLQRPPKMMIAARRHLNKVRGADACVDNITSAGEQVAMAVVEVFKAIADCPKANNTANCVSIISTVAEDLTNAATFISEAINACSNGSTNTQCVTDLTQLGSALADAARRVSNAVAACSQKEIGQCVEDVLDEVGDIEAIVKNIRDAVEQCKSSQ